MLKTKETEVDLVKVRYRLLGSYKNLETGRMEDKIVEKDLPRSLVLQQINMPNQDRPTIFRNMEILNDPELAAMDLGGKVSAIPLSEPQLQTQLAQFKAQNEMLMERLDKLESTKPKRGRPVTEKPETVTPNTIEA